MVAFRRHFDQVGWMILVFIIALGLRMWGIDNGLPYVQRPDEVGDIAQSLQIVRGETPRYTYHRVAWPVLQIPVHATHYLINAVQTQDFSIMNFEQIYYTDRASFIFAARIYLSLYTSLACVLIAAATFKLTNSRIAGFIGGVALALYPSHVYLSKIALPDAFATFGVALALCGAVYMMHGQSRWAYAFAGIGAAIAILARLQTVVLVIIPIVLAHLVAWGRTQESRQKFFWTKWLWAFAPFVAAHIILNPFIVLNPQAVVNDIRFIFEERYTGSNNWQEEYQVYQPFKNVTDNLSLPVIFLRPYMLALFVLLTILALRIRALPALVIIFSGWLFIFSILPTTIPRITFWLPAVIPISMVIGWGANQLMPVKGHLLRAVGVLALVLAGIFALVETVKISTVLASTDTQSLAYDYIRTTIPENSRIMIGDTFIYAVPINRNLSSIERLGSITELPPSYAFYRENPELLLDAVYDVFGYEYIPDIQSDDDMERFIEEFDIQYVVETDYCGGSTAYNFASGLTFPVITDVTRANLTLVQEISPFGSGDCVQHIENRTHMEYMRLWDWDRVGPVIRIYATQVAN